MGEPDPRFVEHMDPNVFWLGDPEFDAAWREMTGDETMNEVGYTKPSGSYPGFINAALGDGEMVVTVRGDPAKGPPGTPEADQITVAAPTTQLRMPLDDWDQFVAHVTQMRARAGIESGEIATSGYAETDEQLYIGMDVGVTDATVFAMIDRSGEKPIVRPISEDELKAILEKGGDVDRAARD